MKILLSLSLVASLFMVSCTSTDSTDATSDQKTSEKTDTVSLIEQIKNSPEKGLKEWSSFPVGGAVDIKTVLNDSKLTEITAHNFSSITATNDMKMYCIIPTEGPYNFGRVDTLVDFCEKNDQRLFGHALVWHYGAPYWIQEKGKANGGEWVDQFLQDYIDTVVTRYKGRVDAWDVVNEAFESKGGGFRKSFWYEMMGPDYIAKSYQYAHKADPDAKLFYNDFNIESYPEKLEGVLKMVEDFKKRDIPLHGIGFQMHIRMDTDEEAIETSLRKVAETGLLVHISELDIIFNSHDDTESGGIQEINELTDELKEAQAQKYKNIALIYRKVVPKEQQYGITFWDFTDRDTWIKPFFDLNDWPTVFDEKLDPKPAYYGFAEGLAEEME